MDSRVMTSSTGTSETSYNLLQDDEGLSTVEYVIILILIAIVAIVAWENFGQSVEAKSRQATGSINGLP